MENQRLTSGVFNTVSTEKAIKANKEKTRIPMKSTQRYKYRMLIRTLTHSRQTAKTLLSVVLVKCTQGRKDTHSTRTREYWAKKKADGLKNHAVLYRAKN